MRLLTSMLFLIPGIIHLVPTVGVVSDAQLARLYGLDTVLTADLSLLLRHRAVLLGLVGAMLVVAGVRGSLRMSAGLMGLASMLSFLWLAWTLSPVAEPMLRVVWMDVLAVAMVLVGTVLHARQPASRSEGGR